MNKFLLVGLASTRAVAVDNQGRVYIGDRENQRIQIFDPDGRFIQRWAGIGYPTVC
jgi:streptogramin lyase